LKKPTGSVWFWFYKQKTKPKTTKNRAKPSQTKKTEPKLEKTEKTEPNRFNPVSVFFSKKF